MRAALAVGLAIALSACASEPWDSTDRTLGYTALAATVADWGQARYIAAHPAQFRDENPLLGQYPSRGKVDAYFVGAIGGGYLLADALPSRYRKYFLGGAAVLEFSVVRHNRLIGVGFKY